MIPDHESSLTFSEEIAELSVLLPGHLIEGLERASYERGVTAAQMIRKLIQEFLLAGRRRGHDLPGEPVRQWA
jgi:hypothetical protein